MLHQRRNTLLHQYQLLQILPCYMTVHCKTIGIIRNMNYSITNNGKYLILATCVTLCFLHSLIYRCTLLSFGASIIKNRRLLNSIKDGLLTKAVAISCSLLLCTTGGQQGIKLLDYLCSALHAVTVFSFCGNRGPISPARSRASYCRPFQTKKRRRYTTSYLHGDKGDIWLIWHFA